MKLERLNENQIRCTLDKSDLEQRKLRFSELACGSVKAREFFRDMMQKASAELGFEVENIPLVIEAIPVSSDCLILVVTKVEDPEELEARLSLLSQLAEAGPEGDAESDSGDDLESLDPLGLLAPFARAIAEARKQTGETEEDQSEPDSHSQIFIFENLDQIISLAAFLVPFFRGESILYKEEYEPDQYYLFLEERGGSQADFKRACLIASEYGTIAPVSYTSLAYCREHCRLLFKDSALETLNQLN